MDKTLWLSLLRWLNLNGIRCSAALALTLTACAFMQPIPPAAPQGPTRMFVVTNTTSCASMEGARNGNCKGVRDYVLGEEVRATPGLKGVRKIPRRVHYGQEEGYIRASAVAKLPDTSKQMEFAASVDKDYPASVRIPPGNWQYNDLMSGSKTLRERKVILVANWMKLHDMQVRDGVLTFTMWVPTTINRPPARVQFRLTNVAYTALQKRLKETYTCGPGYCDAFGIVAHLTTEKVELEGDRGTVARAPVLVIEQFSDRYGLWKAEDVAAR